MPKRLKPDFYLVRMDETSDWNPEFLKQHGITRIWTLYVYDASAATYCCETTPSRELHFVEFSYELDARERTEEERDIIDAETNTTLTPQITYLHTYDVDGLPADQRVSLGCMKHWRDIAEDERIEYVVDVLHDWGCEIVGLFEKPERLLEAA